MSFSRLSMVQLAVGGSGIDHTIVFEQARTAPTFSVSHIITLAPGVGVPRSRRYMQRWVRATLGSWVTAELVDRAGGTEAILFSPSSRNLHSTFSRALRLVRKCAAQTDSHGRDATAKLKVGNGRPMDARSDDPRGAVLTLGSKTSPFLLNEFRLRLSQAISHGIALDLDVETRPAHAPTFGICLRLASAKPDANARTESVLRASRVHAASALRAAGIRGQWGPSTTDAQFESRAEFTSEGRSAKKAVSDIVAVRRIAAALPDLTRTTLERL